MPNACIAISTRCGRPRAACQRRWPWCRRRRAALHPVHAAHGQSQHLRLREDAPVSAFGGLHELGAHREMDQASGTREPCRSSAVAQSCSPFVFGDVLPFPQRVGEALRVEVQRVEDLGLESAPLGHVPQRVGEACLRRRAALHPSHTTPLDSGWQCRWPSHPSAEVAGSRNSWRYVRARQPPEPSDPGLAGQLRQGPRPGSRHDAAEPSSTLRCIFSEAGEVSLPPPAFVSTQGRGRARLRAPRRDG